MSLTTPSLVNVSPVHHSPDLRQMEGPPTEATLSTSLNMYCLVTLAPIGEHSQFTGFAHCRRRRPMSHSQGSPCLGTRPPPQLGGCQHFHGTVGRMIHSRLETPRTPSCLQGPSTFREPYPVSHPSMAPAAFVHSPDPRPVSWKIVQLVAGDTQVHTGGRGLLAHSPADDISTEQHPSTLIALFGYTSPTTVVRPSLPAAQSGTALDATAPDATNQPATPSTISVPPAPLHPRSPRQRHHHSTLVTPRAVGASVPNYPPAHHTQSAPTRSVATLPAVPRWSTGPMRGKTLKQPKLISSLVGSHRSCTPL